MPCLWERSRAPFAKPSSLLLDCLRSGKEIVRPLIEKAHHLSRRAFELVESPPRDQSGTLCQICVNRCQIPEGGWGYCGLRTSKEAPSKEFPAGKGMQAGIMLGRRQTAWPIGSVRLEQVLVSPDLPMPKVRNTGLRTLRSSITGAHLTAFSARTGTTEKGSGRRRGSLRKN